MTRLVKLAARGIVRSIEVSRACITNGHVTAMEYWVHGMPDGQGWHRFGLTGNEKMVQGLSHIQARGIITHTGGVVIAREDMPRVEREILAEYRRRKADPQLVGAIGGVFPADQFPA